MDEKIILTFDEAVSLLNDADEQIHTFIQPGAGMFIGADWDRKDIADALIEWAELCHK